MRKFTLSMLVFFVSVLFMISSAFSQTQCEDFDALTPGGYVAGQLGGYWTTWGGTPGGADDAFVTDANSHSPSNSFAIDDAAMDVVFQLGDAAITTGMWMYSHYMYVPTGFSGYFNVQSDPTPGVDWNLELYFYDGGAGEFGGQSAETFTYTQDVWFMVEIMYDLDGGMGYVYFDGNMVLEFANALSIGGIDYWGWTDGGAPGAHYDDVCFGEYMPGPACEDFDDLTAGGYVAEQLGGYWTTWGGTPGGADDAFVSDAQSNSPSNSFVVDGGNVDLVFQFGDAAISTGMWMYSHYMYVPTGYSGYFNVQADPTPGVDWNIEIYFDDGGTGTFGGQPTGDFTYSQDTWFMVEIMYDLDGGMGYVYFDGMMVLEFANAMSIGGIDYYGADSGGEPGAYYDDVCFGEYVPGDGCEDFDALTVGGYVAEQLGGYWTTWGGTPGGADDAMVSDAQSNSPSNSFVVDGGNVDLIYQFGDAALSEGQWMYSHYIYVPTGNSGYFNIQADPTPGVDWNLDVFFNDGGAGEFGTQSTSTFTYEQDTWILFQINYDLDAGLADVWLDGVLIETFENTITIGGVDYYGYDAGGPPGAFYDDVCFGEGYEISTADCENFDALTAGDYVAGQLGGYWTTWGGTPGGADDALVSNAQSNSPDNSFVVDGGNVDLIFQFGDEAITTGQWLYSHYIYVPSGFSGYFNVQADPTPGVDWNLDVFFNDGGEGEFGTQSTDVFTYEQDTWILFEVNYDLDAGMAWAMLDGQVVTIFENTISIGGVDYYGYDAGGPPGAFYDDVCFGEGSPYTGLEEPVNNSFSAVIFPNPARDQITIQSQNIIDEVRIYNNMGQLVYSGEFDNSQIMVNTSNFNTGMYIVQVRSGEAIEVRKLIVE